MRRVARFRRSEPKASGQPQETRDRPSTKRLNTTPSCADTPSAMAESNDALLGRIAVHTKLITQEQLRDATAAQARAGGSRKLGELLVEKKLISPAQLEKLLAAQKQVLAKQAAKKAEQTITAIIPEPEPGAVATPPPSRAPAPAAAKPAPAAAKPAAARVEPARGGAPSEELHAMLRATVEAGASDIHLHAGAVERWRRHGKLEERPGAPLDPARCETLLRSILTPAQAAALEKGGQVDVAYTLSGVARFRGNVYREQRGLDATFRVIPDHPPSLDELGLPSTLARLTNYHQGMVLVTGPSGCGKSATMAAFLNLVNEDRTDHILTIEDPIEVLHPAKSCQVNQRQVGPHTQSFARALRAALREDPDVIAIGELRDLETISLALTAAETGHFVLGTLHTGGAIRTIDRLIGVFPPDQQSQVRTMLSESLRAVVSQRLVARADGTGRVPALEVLVVNKAVGNLIRENKTFQIRSILQTGAAQGMCLLDSSLEALVKGGTITRDEARRNAEEPKRFGGTEA
jgi:twitching motility protein PilT